MLIRTTTIPMETSMAGPPSITSIFRLSLNHRYFGGFPGAAGGAVTTALAGSVLTAVSCTIGRRRGCKGGGSARDGVLDRGPQGGQIRDLLGGVCAEHRERAQLVMPAQMEPV